MQRRPSAASLELLPRAAGAGIVPADLRRWAAKEAELAEARRHLSSLCCESIVELLHARDHADKQLLSAFWRDRLLVRPHRGIGIVLVGQGPDRNERPATLLAPCN